MFFSGKISPESLKFYSGGFNLLASFSGGILPADEETKIMAENESRPIHREFPTITLQEGNGRTREVPVNRELFIIGRDSDSDIVIAETNVSRHHAALHVTPDGVFIEDLGSANGTFLNSMPIVQLNQIKHLDVIQIGSSMLVFNDPDNSGARAGGTEVFDNGDADFTFESMREIIRLLEKNIGIVFKGKPGVIRDTLVCMMADGHLLLEDAPGVGKSILAQALAKSIQARYRRIQFTPDMLPSDITGANIYDEKLKQFRFVPGPIFGNVILADEINRTTPRTQSSLLECMSESVVTIDGKGRVLPKPFFVIATQNPEDYHGTYPLPEPQLDRFLMRLSIGYPSPEDELEILTSQQGSHPLSRISFVVKGSDIVHCHALVRKVAVADKLKEYIVKITDATRHHPALANGCSPRATLALMRASQSLAAYSGRDYVTPHDVRQMAPAVLAHRMRLRLRFQGEWQRVDRVLESILESIPMDNEDAKL